MNTASKEWTERGAARNAVETAKARHVQQEFLWNQTAAPATPETEAAR